MNEKICNILLGALAGFLLALGFSRACDKLTGNDFYQDEKISVQEQVRRLITQATSRYNLCQSYLGWWGT